MQALSNQKLSNVLMLYSKAEHRKVIEKEYDQYIT